ncbi:uncharacterized protein LOC107359783 isoform X1 [Tetranychus urticae]|uniref:uncharacterized protein LOC107359783 isoform X1 n=1 Tax=Tetranychus urticae TaxID=32264 RepID=UPI00077BA056|nr:uncharacterized protein LOC107359783 isoform X1 [Tetranychus urticae]
MIMKNDEMCLIILFIQQLLIWKAESRGIIPLNCVYNNQLCESVEAQISDDKMASYLNKDAFDIQIGDDSELNDLDDYGQPFLGDEKRVKVKKSKTEINLDPLIPILTQIAAKRKQEGKNRKDDPNKAPNRNFQTQGWR